MVLALVMMAHKWHHGTMAQEAGATHRVLGRTLAVNIQSAGRWGPPFLDGETEAWQRRSGTCACSLQLAG